MIRSLILLISVSTPNRWVSDQPFFLLAKSGGCQGGWIA